MKNQYFPKQQGEQIMDVINKLTEKYTNLLEGSSKSTLYKRDLFAIRHDMFTILHNYCRNLDLEPKEKFPYVENQEPLENINYERVSFLKKEKAAENYGIVNHLVKSTIVETETQKTLESKGKTSQSVQRIDEVSQAFLEYENINDEYEEKIQNIIEFISQNSYECPKSRKENPEEIYLLKNLTSDTIDFMPLQKD